MAYELIQGDQTLGIFNTKTDVEKYIKDNESKIYYIVWRELKKNWFQIDFGAYHRFYYVRKTG